MNPTTAMEDWFTVLCRFLDLFCGSHATSYWVNSYMVLKVNSQQINKNLKVKTSLIWVFIP